jgi:hypothetical protein
LRQLRQIRVAGVGHHGRGYVVAVGRRQRPEQPAYEIVVGRGVPGHALEQRPEFILVQIAHGGGVARDEIFGRHLAQRFMVLLELVHFVDGAAAKLQPCPKPRHRILRQIGERHLAPAPKGNNGHRGRTIGVVLNETIALVAPSILRGR